MGGRGGWGALSSLLPLPPWGRVQVNPLTPPRASASCLRRQLQKCSGIDDTRGGVAAYLDYQTASLRGALSPETAAAMASGGWRSPDRPSPAAAAVTVAQAGAPTGSLTLRASVNGARRGVTAGQMWTRAQDTGAVRTSQGKTGRTGRAGAGAWWARETGRGGAGS